MADGPALALQKALIEALRGDAAVSALVGARVYDEPPQRVTRPYLRIGNLEVIPYRRDGGTDWQATFSLEAHSRPRQGRVEATRIAEAVVALLNDGEAGLSVEGFAVPWVEFVAQAVIRDSDGKSYQANIAFEAMLDPAP